MPFSFANNLPVQAITPLAGFALQNATPGILTWTAPNDGNPHNVLVVGTSQNGAVAAVGGQVTWGFTTPGGVAKPGVQLIGGGQAANAVGHGVDGATVGPGTVVSIQQATAMTAGSTIFYGSIIGS